MTGHVPGLLLDVEEDKNLGDDHDDHLAQDGQDGAGTDQADGGALPRQLLMGSRSADWNITKSFQFFFIQAVSFIVHDRPMWLTGTSQIHSNSSYSSTLFYCLYSEWDLNK